MLQIQNDQTNSTFNAPKRLSPQFKNTIPWALARRRRGAKVWRRHFRSRPHVHNNYRRLTTNYLSNLCCLPNNRVAGSAPAYRIDSRRPRPTVRTPVTGNADRKTVAGQRVPPVIPSARLSNAPGVSDLSRRDGRL